MPPRKTNPSNPPKNTLSQFPESDRQKRGTYNVIPSLPLEYFQTDITDDDAEADEWDNAEYERQMRVHLTQQYMGNTVLELRKICGKRGLKVRGSKDELVERVVTEDVEKMYGGGADRTGQGSSSKG